MSDPPSDAPRPTMQLSSEWWRAVLENTRDIVTVLDRELAIRYASPSVEEVLGYRPDELRGHDALRLVHPADHDAVHDALQVLRDAGARVALEVRARHRDGSWRDLEITGRQLLDEPRIRGILINARDITERRQAEQALRESERALSALLRDLPGMVYRCVMDPAWSVSFVSAGALALTGYAPSDLSSGRVRFAELIHPEDQDRVRGALLSAIRARDQYTVEYRVRTAGGEERWVRDLGRPLFDEQGDFLTLEGIVADVTAQRLAEERARELVRIEAARDEARAASHRIQMILDSITDGFVAVDDDWRITYVNRRGAEIGRCERANLLGRDLWEAYPYTAPEARAHLRSAMEEQVPVHYETFYPPLNLWLEVHAHPSSGGLAIYFHDISERRRAEQALRASEERFRQLADNIGEVFWMFTPDFSRTLYVNAAYQAIVGSSPEALYRNPLDFLDHVHPDDHGRMRAAMARLPLGETTVEVRVVRPDGEVRWLVARGFPIVDAEGRVVQIAGVTRDVTERELAEMELRRQHTILQSIIEGTPDAVFVKDAEGAYLLVNSTVSHLLGRSREEILGKTDASLWPPELAENIRACDRAVLDSGEPLTVEEQIPAPTGRRDYHIVKVPYRCEQGTVGGVIGIARDITERKHMEAALRESEERYRLLFREAPIPMWLFDLKDLRFVETNEAAARRYGYSRDEFLSLSLFDIRLTEDRDQLLEVQDILAQGLTDYHARRVRHRTKTGALLVVDVFAHRLVYNGRQLWMASVVDETEQVRAESELRESEERFRQLAENIHAVFWIFDADFQRTIYVSPAYEEVWGQSREQLYQDPRHCLASAYPEDRERLRVAMERVREGPQTAHFRIRRSDGEERWLEWRGFPVHNPTGRVYRVAGITEDITVRKRAETSLRRKSELVRLLQVAAVAANESEQLADAMRAVMDQVCQFVRFRVGHARLLESEAPVEPRPSDLWCLSDPDQFAEFRAVTERSGVPGDASLLDRVRTTGEPVWITDLALAPEYPRAEVARRAGLHAGIAFPVLAGGEVVAVMEFFSEEPLRPDDLMLEAMSNIGTQLGRVVERRRAEEALRAAKEEAERANRAKSDFLSRMSHELRTPMNAILGFAQVLEMDLTREDDQESIQLILRAGRHLLNLIDEVLDLAKIEAGRVSLSMEPVWIADVVSQAMDLVRATAADKGVSMAMRQCDYFAYADQQRLKQVVLNLLSNAVKYNRPDGRVDVSCEPVARDRIRVRVSDTGAGLSAEQRARLFTAFDRLGAEGSSVPGTGLGLSLSRGLVQAMGGTMGVDSTPGQGSTFWVELPRADAPEGAGEEERASAPDAIPVEPRRTVLYIEDNLSNLRLIARVLARTADVALIPAMQGRLGLELARKNRPDLILLDMHLPDLDGHEVMAELQQDPLLREIPVVVISADATPPQIERMRRAGVREYLTKPIDVSRFLSVVEAALGSGKGDA